MDLSRAGFKREKDQTLANWIFIIYNNLINYTVDTLLITEFWLLQNCVNEGKCVTKGVSGAFSDDLPMK